jgi:hypothetical protein
MDYGPPVIVDFGGMAFNPVGMMVTQAYGISRAMSSAQKEREGHNLRQIYDFWSKLIGPTSKAAL